MPMYEYKCGNCGKRFERIQKFSDEPLTVHEECGGGPVERLISLPSFQFKGTGWYVTDYAKNGGNAAAGSEAKSKSESGDTGKSESSKSDGGKSESKSESSKSESSKSESSKSDSSNSGSSAAPKSDSSSSTASSPTKS